MKAVSVIGLCKSHRKRSFGRCEKIGKYDVVLSNLKPGDQRGPCGGHDFQFDPHYGGSLIGKVDVHAHPLAGRRIGVLVGGTLGDTDTQRAAVFDFLD